MYKDKKYLNTVVIAICFFLWPLIIPPIIGIVLLIMQMLENKKLNAKYGMIDSLDLAIQTKERTYYNKDNEINLVQSEINSLQLSKQQLQKDLEQLTEEFQKEEIALSLDYSSYDSLTSEECKNQLTLLKQEEKEMVKNGAALFINATSSSKKEINDNSKQILRCYNAECDNIILSVSVKNIDSLRNKITKSFEAINKIFMVDGIQLTQAMLEIKLKELTLLYNYEQKKAEEKEIQRAIKEQMIEEEKVRKELEKKQQQLEKDEKQFNNEVSKLMKYLQKTDSEVEKQLYADKIAELEARIKKLEAEKEDVLNRQENAKAGFVYVISNIGSFGENIFKIGMTRRLEPMDRIKELSSASVPFEFDVHAMIFSENAPELETKLHNHFDSYRVNKINPRKEFFHITIDEIAEYVEENYDNTVSFTKIPVAKDYRDTIALMES